MHTDVRFCVHFFSWGGQALSLCYHRPDPVTHVGDDLAEEQQGTSLDCLIALCHEISGRAFRDNPWKDT